MMALAERMSACRAARLLTLEAIANTVAGLVIGRTSEAEALDKLVAELGTRGLTEYWYPAGEEAGPGQNGCIVAFDTVAAGPRTAFDNARRFSSSPDVRWEGYGYFYASPEVVTVAGRVVWADAGCTIYTGGDDRVRSVLRSVWSRNRQVIQRIERCPNPTTRDLYAVNELESSTRGLRNLGWSVTGRAYNIGHSLPSEVRTDPADAVGSRLIDDRTYLDDALNMPLAGEMWTYEARDASQDLDRGTIQFHEILVVLDGTVHRLPGCEHIFAQAGMGWIL